MKVLLIDNYDSFTYNLYHYISKFNKNVDVIRNDKINSKVILKKEYKKIVISPGPGNPNQAGNCLKIVKDVYKKIPILGVCLGHQSIAQALGGVVKKAKAVMHGKTSKIFHNGTGVFKNINSPFLATRYHSLAIEAETLPDGLEVNAWTEDKSGNLIEIMGVQHLKCDLHGVQFHPESIESEFGHELIGNFLTIRK